MTKCQNDDTERDVLELRLRGSAASILKGTDADERSGVRFGVTKLRVGHEESFKFKFIAVLASIQQKVTNMGTSLVK